MGQQPKYTKRSVFKVKKPGWEYNNKLGIYCKEECNEIQILFDNDWFYLAPKYLEYIGEDSNIVFRDEAVIGESYYTFGYFHSHLEKPLELKLIDFNDPHQTYSMWINKHTDDYSWVRGISKSRTLLSTPLFSEEESEDLTHLLVKPQKPLI